VAQLYPRALGSLFVTSYDSQGCGGGILTHLLWSGVLAADSQSTSASGYRVSLGTLGQILSSSSYFIRQLLFSSFEGAFSDEKTGLYFTVRSLTKSGY
jgi:hypothetical protein